MTELSLSFPFSEGKPWEAFMTKTFGTTQANMPVLLLGGAGKTGRRVAERLVTLGFSVRLGSRSSQPSFDWENKSIWGKVVQGVETAYITYYPDLAVPGAIVTVRSFAELAVANGVKKLVLLSGRGEEEAQRAEGAVREVHPETTIVRCSWFNQNFSESFFLEPILSGEVALPNGNVPEPFVDADDIADVVVAALTEEGHAGKIYELTGPRLLTLEEAVSEIVKVTNREIRFTPVSVEAYASTLTKQHVPNELVTFLSYLFGEVLDGRNASVTDGVQRALGREPKDFSDYVKTTAATGVWSA
jgi:uncharacterized protein YbjT (DUF2867 family)